ncbi:hypothetical protein BH09SUM1_BH09SUM1_20300 [soil metagenome]
MRVLVAIFLFVVVVAVAGAFLGVFDLRTLRTKATVAASNARADIGGAVKNGARSANTGPRAVKDAQLCRDNLRRIEAAKRTLKSTGKVNFTWEMIVKQMGGERLACPNGGTYDVGSRQVAASCSVGDNNTDVTADDHSIDKK